MSTQENPDWETTVREIRDYAQEEFDKLIVYLSSGGLVLTVGFVKDLVDLNSAVWKPLLILAWTGFVASLFLILSSHKSAIKAMTLELDKKEEQSDAQDETTRSLNFWSFTSLIIAVILFIVFITINLYLYE
ncbi:hypothetical protein [Fodinibius halophilus]|uniref:Uncharacterized protein n=1 Tax=Fodinibius halophilus TaxID=1736908 RepID=A0A6M1T7R4_9BACT|nr:hypothetical protein [Fodinibius halophilus]NGP88021.1 hypothetical protein [Fodinibius halophilus]